MCDLNVTCDDCGKTGTKALPSVDLFGSTVIFTDEHDEESMFVLHANSEVCYDCIEEGLDGV